MFRSVLISHDGSRCVESTVKWLEPLLGKSHSHVELYGRQNELSSELNSPEHLRELADEMTKMGADVQVLEADADVFAASEHKLAVVHNQQLALRILRETTASVFYTPDGISPHVPTRVVVPLDGSEFAEEILPLLVPFAKAFQPKVELLRVEDWGVEHRGSLMSGTEDPTRAALVKSLEHAKQTLAKEGIEATTRATEPGEVHRKIIEAAAEDPDSLVALSTHGRKGLLRWIFGSCAESTIKAGTTPVLIRNPRMFESD